MLIHYGLNIQNLILILKIYETNYRQKLRVFNYKTFCENAGYQACAYQKEFGKKEIKIHNKSLQNHIILKWLFPSVFLDISLLFTSPQRKAQIFANDSLVLSGRTACMFEDEEGIIEQAKRVSVSLKGHLLLVLPWTAGGSCTAQSATFPHYR